MGMTFPELETFTTIRKHLTRLIPLIAEASQFPNPFGGYTDDQPVCFPIDGYTVSFRRKPDGTLIMTAELGECDQVTEKGIPFRLAESDLRNIR